MSTLSDDARKFILHIEDEFDNLEKFTSGCSFQDYECNKMLQYAIHKSLENIGEACRHISNKDGKSEVKSKFPEFDFSGLIGFKNKINHDYFAIDYEMVWDTVTYELPEIKSNFYKAFAEDLEMLCKDGKRSPRSIRGLNLGVEAIAAKASGRGIETSQDDISTILGDGSQIAKPLINQDPEP